MLNRPDPDGTAAPSKSEPDPLGWALTAGVGLAYAGLFASWNLLVDDAFISFRYAEHLAAGEGLVFNLGERVEGYSNLSWVLLLAGGRKLGVEPTTASVALGFGCGLGVVVCTGLAARRTLALGRPAALAAALLVALNPSFSFWSQSGLESALFAWLLVTAWVVFWEPPSRTRDGLFVAAAGLLAVTRPEGLAFSVLAALAAALDARRHGSGRWLLAGGILTLGAGSIAFRMSYFGELWPNTFHAKVALGSAGVWRGLSYVGAWAGDDGGWIMLPLVSLAAWRSGRIVTLGALSMLYLAFIVGVGGDGLYRYRLPAHVAPLLALLAASGLERTGGWRLPGHASGWLLVAGSLVWPASHGSFFRGHSLREVRAWEQRWTEVGMALKTRMPDDTRLATNVAGRVPYHSDLHTLDLLGLTDRAIARAPTTNAGQGYAGHERAAPELVLARAPDVIYFSVLDGAPPVALAESRVAATLLRRGALYRYGNLLERPAFQEKYRVGVLTIPGGDPAPVFVRRKSPAAACAPSSP